MNHGLGLLSAETCDQPAVPTDARCFEFRPDHASERGELQLESRLSAHIERGSIQERRSDHESLSLGCDSVGDQGDVARADGQAHCLRGTGVHIDRHAAVVFTGPTVRFTTVRAVRRSGVFTALNGPGVYGAFGRVHPAGGAAVRRVGIIPIAAAPTREAQDERYCDQSNGCPRSHEASLGHWPDGVHRAQLNTTYRSAAPMPSTMPPTTRRGSGLFGGTSSSPSSSMTTGCVASWGGRGVGGGSGGGSLLATT